MDEKTKTQLVIIDSKLMSLLCPFQTSSIWEKACALSTNVVSQFYDVISQITNLRKEEVDMSTYLGQVRAVMEEFERLI